nr:hypothetical protein [Kineococcus indalonis]
MPSGFEGEFTTSARVRGPTAASRSAGSGRKPRSARSAYGTGTAPTCRAAIAKFAHPGSGTSTSSPASSVSVIAWCSACIPPAVTHTRSGSTARASSRASFAATAARSGSMPPLPV